MQMSKLAKIKLKVEYYDTMIEYLEDILKMIHNRDIKSKTQLTFYASKQVWVCDARTRLYVGYVYP